MVARPGCRARIQGEGAFDLDLDQDRAGVDRASYGRQSGSVCSPAVPWPARVFQSTGARLCSVTTCGFKDPVALRKHFHTHLGLSPLAYRRAHCAPVPVRTESPQGVR
ncbi:hypothetical protein AB0D14_31120 [Streptomyces sp. NPDC048484]|uniref:hypothetical protein n=1 Tax=Streptomyces sp. NPDC048484 TaxID=3155146 RepID=UPI0034496F9C